MPDKQTDDIIDALVAESEKRLLDEYEGEAFSKKSKIGRLCLIFREPVVSRLAARLVSNKSLKMKAIRELLYRHINDDVTISTFLTNKGHTLPIEFCHAEFLVAMRAGFEADKSYFAESLRILDRKSREMKERIKKRTASAPASDVKPAPAVPEKKEPPVKLPPAQKHTRGVSVPHGGDSAPPPAGSLQRRVETSVEPEREPTIEELDDLLGEFERE